MRMTYDPVADAAYIYVEEAIAPGSAVSNEIVERHTKGDIVLDFDADGHLLGVEIIGARALLTPAVIERADQI